MLDQRYYSEKELQERQQEIERHVKDIEYLSFRENSVFSYDLLQFDNLGNI